MKKQGTNIRRNITMRENDFPELRNRLKQLAKDNGKLTYDEMAEKIGCSRDTYKKWINESNYRAPSLEWLMKISDAFKVSLDYLMGKSDYTAIDGKAISKITGLSDNAIKRLQAWNHCDDPRLECILSLDELLSSEKASDYFQSVYQYIDSDYLIIGLKTYDTDLYDEGIKKEIDDRDISVNQCFRYRFNLANDNYEIGGERDINVHDKSFLRTDALNRIKENLDFMREEYKPAEPDDETLDHMTEREMSDDYQVYIKDIDGNTLVLKGSEYYGSSNNKKE